MIILKESGSGDEPSPREINRLEINQTPEQVRELLESAVETMAKVKLTVLTIDGKSAGEGIVRAFAIDKTHLAFETEEGDAFSLELNRIIGAEFAD